MLNLIEIFRDRVSIETLALQREVDYQAAIKEGLELYIGVGYSSEKSSDYCCTYYLVENDSIKKKYYWRWEYPRVPLKIDVVKSEHLHWLKFSDIRSALIELDFLSEKDFEIYQTKTFSNI